MNSAAFTFIDTAIGGAAHRNNIQRIDAFHPNGTPDVYATYRRFTEDLRAYTSTNLNPKGRPSVSGYNGPCWSPFFPIDIDVDGDLDTALEETRRVSRILRERWEIPLEALRFYYSGNKGFHIEIPETLFGGFGILPAQVSAARFKALSALLITTADALPVDPAIYDPMRLWRVENTRNARSGRYKVPLTAAELFTLTAEQIAELGRSPRNVDVPDADEWDPIPALEEAWAATAHQHARPRSAPATAADGEPITHGRNNYLFSVGGRIRAAVGLGEAPMFAALWEHNLERCEPPLDEAEVRQIASSLMRYPAGTLPPPPPEDPDIAELREKLRIAEAAAMDTAIVRDQKDRLEAQVRRLAELPNAIHALLMNPQMTPTVKVAIYALGVQYHARKDDEEYQHPELGVRVDMRRAAEIGGMDGDTLSTTARKVQEQTGVWMYATEQERFNGIAKRPLTHSHIKLADAGCETMAATLRTFATTACGRKAYTRQQKPALEPELCSCCGNPTVYNETIKHCKSCDHVLEEKKPVHVKHRPVPEISVQEYVYNPVPEISVQEDARSHHTVDTPPPAPVVHFVPAPGEGIEELDIWQGMEPPRSLLVCRHVFGQQCYNPGCKHQMHHIPIGAG